MRKRPIFPIASLLLLSCGSSDAPTPDTKVHPIYVAPTSLDALSGEHFYDLPWPNDARRESDGTIRIAGFYNRYNNAFLADLTKQASHLLHGFSLAGSHYFRFDGALRGDDLPTDPAATTAASSLVQILDIDRASPEYGKRKPLFVTFRAGGKEDVYYLPNTLQLTPSLGSPLRPGTRYATIVRKGLHDDKGREVEPSRGVSVALGLEPPKDDAERAHVALQTDVPGILAELGVPPSEVLDLTVFTTDDPTKQVFALADYTKASFEPPVVRDNSWKQRETDASLDVYEGIYGPSPIFQSGTPPYRDSGGEFVFDANGSPVVQGQFDLRFTLIVPNASKCPMPAGGYPVLIYAHGTGGNYRSVYRESGSVGTNAASVCVAAIGTDQIFHGTRPGAPDPNDPRAERDIELAFFNLLNMRAGRSNPGQSAIDLVQEARLFTVTKMKLPAAVSRSGQEVAFDGSRIIFAGHSQGGINGPLFLAADNQARGGILSGTGAVFMVSLLDKTQPDPPIRGLVKAFAGLYTPETEGELNLQHPALTMAQSVVELGDPVSYMHRIAREPRPGFAPKSILQTEGIREDGTGDNFTPVRAIEAGAAIMGLPLVAPTIHAFGALPDPGTLTLTPDGVSGNLANGLATGALAQFRPATGRDGHFVLFDVPAARTMSTAFMKDLVDDPKGRLRSP